MKELSDVDFSDKENGFEEIKLKGEMIILKELGIIDLLTKTQKLNNSETAKRIRIILSDKIEKSKLKNPQKYIENILTAISYGTPEITSDKTPYKKQNIKYALTELTRKGLSIEDTTYLKVLKQTNPNLFGQSLKSCFLTLEIIFAYKFSEDNFEPKKNLLFDLVQSHLQIVSNPG